MEDQRDYFHKKLIIYLGYKILSFETLLFPNDNNNVLSASISFSFVFGSIIFEKSNDWQGA